MHHFAWVLLAVAIALIDIRPLVAKEPAEVPSELSDYVAAPDDSYAYEVDGTDEIDGCAVHKLTLTSQTWQGIPWKHALYIYVPEELRHGDSVLLFITGGKIGGEPKEDEIARAVMLAKLAAMPIAFLHQVPNQPLLGDRVEDDLISETFLRYLKTKDATWPLLFPMVKSATAAMTAIEDFGQKHYGVDVRNFVVTGGSKRGWTTWLTAVVDDRVAGIAPIVIDTLNLRPQMQYQLETWGEYSEQIADYTSKGLVEVMEKQPEIPLWRWVDPYTYRSEMELPKLLINGTNDRYWVVDATNLYWDGLVGQKHLRYVPNAGHGLDGGQEGALATLAAFANHVADGEPMPEISWDFKETGGEIRLTFGAAPAPKSARLWVAHSDTKDFRNAKWTAADLKPEESGGNGDGAEFVGSVLKPEKGHVALFGEVTYDDGPVPFNLSTGLKRD